MSYDDRSQWADPTVPEYFDPVSLFLDRHVQSGRGNATALSVDETSYCYSELTAYVAEVLARLVSAGVRPGERVFLFGRDSLDYVASWLASIRLGAIPVVVSDVYRPDDLLYFLADTGARTLLIDAEQIGKLEAIREKLPTTLKTIIIREPDDADPAALKIDGFTTAPGRSVSWLHSLPVASNAAQEISSLHKDDIAYMFYSGGTTGRAKGIPHLVSDFVIIPERHGAYWSYTPDDVVHATSKKYFTHGLWPGVLIPLYWGAHSVISRKDVTAQNVIDVIHAYRPTKLVTVPTVIKSVVNHIRERGDQPDFSSIKLAVTASEKMPLAFFNQFRKIFGIELLDSIGSAEVTYEWIANRTQEYRPGSLGKPVFGFEVRLRDASGNIVTEPGTRGQAEIRSVTATPFYWRKRDLSNQSIIDGWLRTGDELYFDEDGFYWFATRSNDVFKVKGLWVSPLEIEEHLVTDDRVREAAIVSYEDEDGLTKPLAYLVLEPGVKPSPELEEELRCLVRKALGGFKAPGRFTYIEQLPKTTLLKIDRKQLRDNPALAGTVNRAGA
ncbi:AMP-binding protein [Ochrobactrum teleogrylli]|uniref:AMP-binding protein n=1 Tax=Ochrobactrum teleogrylli TaxID=2479765 RepID=UPI00384B04BD